MTAATRSLQIGEGFTLPLAAITEAIALLAQRGAGKTNAAVVFAEEVVKAGQQVIVLDPVGTWWGIRADSAGTGPGLPVLVMGGEHADLPLAVSDAATVAEFLATERVPAILDLSQFTKGEQVRFVDVFAERLWQTKAKEQYRTPVSLILEEAEEWAPQRPMPGEQVMLSRIERLAKLGRNRGIGMLLIRRERLIDLTGGRIFITDAGLAYLGELPRPEDPAELLATWRAALGRERVLLDVLMEHPEGLSKDEGVPV